MRRLNLADDKQQSFFTDKPSHACVRSCSVLCCPLVNDCHLLAGFCNFYLPLSHCTFSMRRIPSNYRVHIWYGKSRMAGLQSGRMMIDSVVWVQCYSFHYEIVHKVQHKRNIFSFHDMSRFFCGQVTTAALGTDAAPYSHQV